MSVYRMCAYMCSARGFTRYTHECDARRFVKDVLFRFCFAFSRAGGHSSSGDGSSSSGSKTCRLVAANRRGTPCTFVTRLPSRTAADVSYFSRRERACVCVCVYSGIAYLAYAPQSVCIRGVNTVRARNRYASPIPTYFCARHSPRAVITKRLSIYLPPSVAGWH